MGKRSEFGPLLKLKILGVLGGKCGVRFLLERVTDISAFGLVLISDWLSPGVRMRTVNSMVNSAVNSEVNNAIYYLPLFPRKFLLASFPQ